MMGEWKDISEGLERRLRLRTLPVAFKLLEKAEELEKIPKVRRLPGKRTLCQLVNTARNLGWTLGATLENFIEGSPCPALIGLCDRPPLVKDGTWRSIFWFCDKQQAKKFENAWPHMPPDKYQAVLVAPLSSEKFEPDIVLIYGKPGQIVVLINGLQYYDFERYEFHSVGESSCADYIVQCYQTRKPSLGIPGWGEIKIGGTQEDEIVIGIPADLSLFQRTLAALDKLANPGGIKYPIDHLQVGPDAFFPKIYMDIFAGRTPEGL